jgi:uncharacterized membrane protein
VVVYTKTETVIIEDKISEEDMKMTNNKNMTKRITFTALFMALNIALSSFGVPVPGGHFYLNDVVICTAAILLDPVDAFIVGGIGAFIGDMIFYPVPMFVSLATHGLQAVVISLCTRKILPNKKMAGAITGVILGAIIMVVGYSLGRAFIYSTPEYAILKLPYQILQAGIGAVAGVLICYPFGIKRVFTRMYAGEVAA